MSDKTNFGFLGRDFQQKLLKAIIEDKKYAERIIDVLDSKYFDNNSFKFIMENIKELYSKYGVVPDYETIRLKIINENGDNQSTKIHIDTINIIKSSENETPYIKDTALNFCKQQNLIKVLKNVDNIIKNGQFEDYEKIEDLVKKAMQVGVNTTDSIDIFENIELALEKDYRLSIPTGIDGIDNLLKGGLARGELGVILAPTGTGKELPISEPVLTPNGWVENGSLKPGDKVIGSDGKEQFVLGVYPQGVKPIYKVEFTDGTFVNCGLEHLWSVNTLNMRTAKTRVKRKGVYRPNYGYKVVKTSDMMKDIKKRGRYNYRLPIVEPVEFEKRDVEVDPYLMGLLLGDGYLSQNPRISTKDDQIFDEIKSLSEHTSFNEYDKKDLKTIKVIALKSDVGKRLDHYGLKNKKSNEKFIPKDYLYNSVNVRISLLQGLMDTDGYVDKRGQCSFATISDQLANDVKELILSLGGTVKIRTKIPTYNYNGEKKNGQLSYNLSISFANQIMPFRLYRKILRYQKRKKYVEQKYVKSISYSHDEEALCIKVSNADELYVTRDYVLTHNTTILTKFANSAFNCGYNVLHIFFEDNINSIKRKHFTIWTGIPPDLQHENKEDIINTVNEVKSRSKGRLEMLKLPSDSVTVTEIKNRIRKMQSEGFKIDLLVLDYVDCLSKESHTEREWEGEGPIMRKLEAMSSEFDIAIWTATQGDRSSISSDVVTSDQMGGSIKKAQIAHVIISIAKTLDQKEHKLATLTLLKSRIGDDGIVFANCKFDNEYLEINTETQNTLLGIEQKKEEDNKERAKRAFKLRQELNNNN
jgi:replicative DNA helicase